jgi:hypothetical protein
VHDDGQQDAHRKQKKTANSQQATQTNTAHGDG